MARPLRLEYPGACYYAMNRGNRPQRRYNVSVKIKSDKKFNAKVAKNEKLVVKS